MKFKECHGCATLYSEYSDMYKSNCCKYCHAQLFDSNYSRKTSLCDDIDLNEIKLYFQYVKNNQKNLNSFSKKVKILSKSNHSYQQEFNNACNEYQNSSHQVKSLDILNTISACPYCGSTNIQLIRRKWSLLTGFLTNKVDRYCVNCKRKF